MSMNTDKGRRIRRAIVPIFGTLFVCYFVIHMLHGNQSIFAWMQLEQEVRSAERTLAEVRMVRSDLEERISLLRSGDVDRDMLEERVRVMTGMAYPDEYIVIEKKTDPR